MRVGRVLAVLAVVALCAGLFTAVAIAGKKKKTTPIFFTGSPKINKNANNVNAKGTLNTASSCKPSRSVRLQIVDASGNVLATVDGDTTDNSGNWNMAGGIPNTLPAGTNYVRVKVNKRTAGKFVCKAGVSVNVAIPAA